MKKLILLAFTALMITGCSQKEMAVSLTEGDFASFEYDSCEYLIRCGGYKGFLAHKGNCKFCKERRQKEIEELVIKLNSKN